MSVLKPATEMISLTNLTIQQNTKSFIDNDIAHAVEAAAVKCAKSVIVSSSRRIDEDSLISTLTNLGYTINVYNTNMYEISWESVNEQEKDKESNSQLCGEVHGRSTKARSTRRKKETPKVAQG
jgi:enolase